ncbi:MAG: NADH-quinone oxidoreductase subunit NuoK [Deltaproteobacteria bacterium]|nr:NADH-quinone oxidoreductase subunit NuoK [Candidatus Tharpella sp.]
MSTNLHTYLIIAVFMLALGLYGLMQHRSMIGMLISIELILNGAGLNFMAFNRFLAPEPVTGQIFTLFIMGLAAAEAAIAVSLIFAVYRKYQTSDPEQINDLRG